MEAENEGGHSAEAVVAKALIDEDRIINFMLIGTIIAGALSICVWNTWLTVTSGQQDARMDRFSDKFRRDDIVVDGMLIRIGALEGGQKVITESLQMIGDGQRDILLEIKKLQAVNTRAGNK